MNDRFQPTDQRQPGSGVIPRPQPIGFDEIDRYVAIGNRMRAQAFASAFRALWRALGAPFRGRRPVEGPLEPFANSLAAIRSAAELMRDIPDLDARDRTRFAEILLREEARLERLLADLRRGGARSA